MGRQLHSGRPAVDEGARRGPSSATSRRDPICPRPASRIASAGITSLVRRRVSRSAGSFGMGARLVPTRPRRRSGLPLRTGPRRRGDALPRDCAVAAGRRRTRDFARSTARETRMAGLTISARKRTGRMHAAMFELMRGDLARAAPNAFELARLAREHDSADVAGVRGVSRGLGER